MSTHRLSTTASGLPSGHPGRRGSALRGVALGAAFGLTLAAPPPAQAKTFECGAGDVLCLTAAIVEANTNGQSENTIFLDAGTYSLTAVDNNTDGPNGLPSITSSLNLIGAGADNTVIERPASSPAFRLMHVAGTGHVTLKQLTVRGGCLCGLFGPSRRGAGLFNDGGSVTIIDSTFINNSAIGAGASGAGLYNADGTVTVTNSILSGNTAAGPAAGGGGIYNAAGGSVTIRHSTLANNVGSAGGGGIVNEPGGTVTITRSSLSSNKTFDPGVGGGIDNLGSLTITNSTISGNSGRSSGGIANLGGTVMITNSTISGNSGQNAGGVSGSVVALQNTILALNESFFAPDCSAVTSLGNNLIGSTTKCDIILQPSDLIGDPGLDTFIDDGTPGNGHYPLLPFSPAIDAGNDEACPKRDQIGQKRHRPCDIGAIEFPDHP